MWLWKEEKTFFFLNAELRKIVMQMKEASSLPPHKIKRMSFSTFFTVLPSKTLKWPHRSLTQKEWSSSAGVTQSVPSVTQVLFLKKRYLIFLLYIACDIAQPTWLISILWWFHHALLFFWLVIPLLLYS